MKQMIQFIVGGVVGFGGAYAALYFRDMNKSEYIFIFIALAIIIGLLLLSIKMYKDVKTLHGTTFTGDAEDEADEIKYKKTSDYAMYTNIAMVLALITVAVAIIQKTSFIFIGASAVMFIISWIAVSFNNKMSKYLYPDRTFPKAESAASGDEYLNQMLDVADEGEKFVILQGLYKSNYWMNALLILGIALTTTYSALQESSQLFAIIVMGVILAVGNIKYQQAIRNK